MYLFRPSHISAVALLAVGVLTNAGVGRADVTRTFRYRPGTPAEAALLLAGNGTSVDADARAAALGGWWTYRIIATPLARLVVTFSADGAPALTVVGSDGKPIPSRLDASGSNRTLYATVPANHPLGSGVRVQFGARTGPIAVRDIVVQLIQPDRAGNGVADAVETMMGAPAGQHAVAEVRPDHPHTSFQTGQPWSGNIAVPADAVLAYTDNADTIRSWLDHGYIVQTMGGFRQGADYAKQHPGAVQTDRSGQPLVIGGDSYYLVPTQERIDAAKRYYDNALAAGSSGVCPEEPEFFTSAGYSDAFKQEWQARYGAPWQPPHSSVDARYRAEQLKGGMERGQIEAILNDAQRVKPEATRMIAIHSPVTYYQWGIPVPHYALLTIQALQEIIGQVWTGTARTAARSAGVRAERTFDVGYLEYSSLFNLARGTGKRVWFLMDPVEDNPSLQMEDYHKNYEATLLASLMFPRVDSFELMPWPQRVFGRVPPGYATEIDNVTGALSDLWQYPKGTVDSGSVGIGTFVADSMGWQRGDPSPSDYDGFYGLCLPLEQHGVRVQVLSLDRVDEPTYLERMKTLLVSYDFLKPSGPNIDKALADWTRHGGSLVVFGGTDAYDAVADSWWRKSGVASPLDDLFAQLGLRTARQLGGSSAAPRPDDLSTVLKADGPVTNMANRRPYVIDLTPYARQAGAAVVRFEDALPQGGYGPQLFSAELRFGNKLATSFRTGSELETRFLAEEHGTGFNGEARFADRNAFWVYRFDNLPRNQTVTLTVDMGNQFLVRAGAAATRAPLIEATLSVKFDRTVQRLRVPSDYELTSYSLPAGATALYNVDGQQAAAPVAWEAKVGGGSVTYVGVAPGFLTATAQSSRWLRALVARAFANAGGRYQEAEALVAHRGPYTAVRTLGDEYTADGLWVNLLSPTLAVVEDPVVAPHGVAFLEEIPRSRAARRDPHLLAASGRVRARYEQPAATGFLVQAPSGTEGVARLWAGGRRCIAARAYTTLGQPVPVSIYGDGESVLLRYTNDADGIVVRAGWK